MRYFAPLLLTLSMAIAPAVAAQTEPSDTVVGIYNQASVTMLTKSNGTQVITISIADNNAPADDYKSLPNFFDFGSPARWNINNLFRKKPRQPRRAHTDTQWLKNLYAGGIIATESNSPIKNGWEIGLSRFVEGEWSAGRGLPSLSLGMGFGWEILNITRDKILDLTDGRLVVIAAPEGSHKATAKIKNFHFTFPLTLNIPMHRSFGLSLMGELHLNTYTTASSSWRLADSRVNRSLKGLHQRLATIDFGAFLGWRGGLGVYVKYSPMDKWVDGYGPEYKTLSIGGSLNF